MISNQWGKKFLKYLNYQVSCNIRLLKKLLNFFNKRSLKKSILVFFLRRQNTTTVFFSPDKGLDTVFLYSSFFFCFKLTTVFLTELNMFSVIPVIRSNLNPNAAPFIPTQSKRSFASLFYNWLAHICMYIYIYST